MSEVSSHRSRNREENESEDRANGQIKEKQRVEIAVSRFFLAKQAIAKTAVNEDVDKRCENGGHRYEPKVFGVEQVAEHDVAQ